MSCRYITGASKSDFKKAVGALYREGLVEVSPFAVTLRPTQGPPPPLPPPREGQCTLYISNLHKAATGETLRDFLQSALGGGRGSDGVDEGPVLVVSDVRLVLDRGGGQAGESEASPTRRNLGYGFVDITAEGRGGEGKGVKMCAQSVMDMSMSLLRGKIFKGKRLTIATATAAPPAGMARGGGG